MSVPLRILHLEDDPNDTTLVQAILGAEGVACEMVRVETREAFVSALAAGGFDLVLADYTLPEFDGMSALTITRQTHADIPFIVLSGTLGKERAIDAMKSGATDYVLKERFARLVTPHKIKERAWLNEMQGRIGST